MSETNAISEARLAANRENSLKSTGPTSPEGKAKIRFNSVKNGLTGQQVPVREEDGAHYAAHVRGYEQQFQPVGPEECALVQSIADIRWRLARIPGLEMALLSRGQETFIEENPSFALPENESQLEICIRTHWEKEFRNLHLHENRLARRREREMAELLRLQAERKAREEEALAAAAAQAALLARHRKETLTEIPGLGFAFSKQRFDTYLARLTPATKQKFLDQALSASAEAQTMEAAA